MQQKTQRFRWVFISTKWKRAMNRLLIVLYSGFVVVSLFFAFRIFLSSPIKSSLNPPALGGWWFKQLRRR